MMVFVLFVTTFDKSKTVADKSNTIPDRSCISFDKSVSILNGTALVGAVAFASSIPSIELLLIVTGII